jgi:hypothetical protein
VVRKAVAAACVEVLVECRVAECNLATVVFAAVFAATVLEAADLEALVLWVALALVVCAFAVEALPPELVWAAATRAPGIQTRAAMRQIRVAVFQLAFRAMYCASPRGLCGALAVVRFVLWSVFPSLPMSFDTASVKKFA